MIKLVSFFIFLVRFQSCWSCHHWFAVIQSIFSSPARKNSLDLQEYRSSTATNSEGTPHSITNYPWIYVFVSLVPFLYVCHAA